MPRYRPSTSQASSASPSSSPRSGYEQMEEEVAERLREIGDYKTGSIARIKLQNFLTYDEVEFRPGPRLNMVIGPNGTGKSSILCAICLGLGGEPKLLGRASDVDTFVKNGEDTAEIEIELVQEGNDNVIIKRIIRRDGKPKSAFLWNGENVAAKEVKDRVIEEFQIQIGNLCTFLPQEKVGNFSGFDSKQLLLETEKTMGDNEELYKTHQDLIARQNALLGGNNQVETLEATLARLESEQVPLRREVERQENRRKAQEQVDLLSKKIIWLKADALRAKACALKEKKDKAQKDVDTAKAEIQPLVNAHEEAQRRYNTANEQTIEFDKIIAAHKQEIKKDGKKYESHDDQIEELLHQLRAMDNERANIEEAAQAQRVKIETIKKQSASIRPLDELKEEFHIARRDHQAFLPQYQAAKKKYNKFKDKLSEIEQDVNRIQGMLQKTLDAKAQRRQKVFARDQDLKNAYEWIRQNGKEFRKPVIGPICCEVTTKSELAAAYLEQHVPNAVLKSFIVQDKADYDLIYRELRDRMKIPVNLIQIDRVSAPEARLYSKEVMDILKADHGVIGYLDEQYEADALVSEALKSTASVQKVLVGDERTQKSMDDHNLGDLLTQPKERGGKPRGFCIFTRSGSNAHKYTVFISNYSKAPTLRQDDIKPAKLLSRGASDDRKKEFERELTAAKEEKQKIEQALSEMEEEAKDLTVKNQDAQARVKNLQEDIRFANKVQTKLETEKRKLAEFEKELSQDDDQKKDDIKKQLNQRVLGALKAIKNQSESHKQILLTHVRATGAYLNKETASADVSSTRMRFEERKGEYEELREAFSRYKREFKEVKAEALAVQKQAKAEAPLEDEDGNETPLKTILEEDLAYFTSVELAEAAREEAERTLQECVFNANALTQYRKNQELIEETTADLDDLRNRKDKRKQELQKLQLKWEQRLEDIVAHVDRKFCKYMKELGCTGSVSLSKGEKDDSDPKFEDYGIEIKVSFRHGVAPSVLSARVQSGGERSVSTIMYLMALQDEMKAPFRCVDEINQGLDERNERLVFRRIVENATKRPGPNGPTDHCGQYWLITPKLLPNLTDMEVEAMTVLCIFNGPYNLKHPTDWDTDKLIQLRKRGNVETADGDDDEAEMVKKPKRKKLKSEEIEKENIDVLEASEGEDD